MPDQVRHDAVRDNGIAGRARNDAVGGRQDAVGLMADGEAVFFGESLEGFLAADIFATVVDAVAVKFDSCGYQVVMCAVNVVMFIDDVRLVGVAHCSHPVFYEVDCLFFGHSVGLVRVE